METRYKHVPYYPQKPLLIWDGDCSFCKYWMLWLKNITNNRVIYEPYQTMADHIPGIPESAFKEAIRLIETDGKVYDGPHAAFQALTYGSKSSSLTEKYARNPFFRKMSDSFYALVARNRSAFFRITKLAWGKDPTQPKKYWVYYLIVLAVIVLLLILLLST